MEDFMKATNLSRNIEYTLDIIKLPHKRESFKFEEDTFIYSNINLQNNNLSRGPSNFTTFCFNYLQGATNESDNHSSTDLDAVGFVVGNCTTKFETNELTEELALHINWWGLTAILVVLLTALGNTLVILAISWDRRLQNMTNYFLLSLAVTDMMVAIFVMPTAIIVLVLGRFPFSSEVCLLWISFDVLFCSASIMHLCTISVDRFLSLRYPMRFGRHKTKRRIILKLVLVWCLSVSTSVPLVLMYASDSRSTIVDGVCQIPVSLFQIIASVIAFYVPLIVMIVTYALTVRLLSQKESELMVAVVDTPVPPLNQSLKLKRLLCKTTSTVSSTTATTIADVDISDSAHMQSTDHIVKVVTPRKRPTLPKTHSSRYRQRTMDPTGRHIAHKPIPRRSFSFMNKNANADKSSLHLPSYFNRSDENISQLASDLEISEGIPLHLLKKQKCTGEQMESHFNIPEINKRIDTVSLNGDHTYNIRTNDGCHKILLGNPIGNSLTFPCSCAPRFFLEGFSDNNTTEVDCEGGGNSNDTYSKIRAKKSHSKLRKKRKFHIRRFGKGFLCCKKSTASDKALESPWHEGETIPTNSNESAKKYRQRLDGLTTNISENQTYSAVNRSASNRNQWRTRTCSASIRLMTSKRHGRNLRMEQKATKVLGVVFFTFVCLWSPFFIINITLGACPTCQNSISEDVINLVTWLGYVSSTVNPFFYTFFNKSFRDAFLKIVKCNMKNRRKYHF